MNKRADHDTEAAPEDPQRRTFLSTTSSVGMAVGLCAGYGTLAAMAGRYLYPVRPLPTEWVFVTDLAGIRPGDSLVFSSPAGAPIVVARVGDRGTEQDFIALSSTCPHLGCRVHWEAAHRRFFCPCHNGTFDPSGKGTGGPPGDAGQSLPRYPLKVQEGLLFIEVPIEKLG